MDKKIVTRNFNSILLYLSKGENDVIHSERAITVTKTQKSVLHRMFC